MSRWSEAWGDPVWSYNMRVLIYGFAFIAAVCAAVWWVAG